MATDKIYGDSRASRERIMNCKSQHRAYTKQNFFFVNRAPIFIYIYLIVCNHWRQQTNLISLIQYNQVQVYNDDDDDYDDRLH